MSKIEPTIEQVEFFLKCRQSTISEIADEFQMPRERTRLIVASLRLRRRIVDTKRRTKRNGRNPEVIWSAVK